MRTVKYLVMTSHGGLEMPLEEFNFREEAEGFCLNYTGPELCIYIKEIYVL